MLLAQILKSRDGLSSILLLCCAHSFLEIGSLSVAENFVRKEYRDCEEKEDYGSNVE